MPERAVRSAVAAVAVVLAVLTAQAFSATAGAAGVDAELAQDAPATTTDQPGSGGEGITTTTLPESNDDLGRIIPQPNSGAEPENPGDRGGWQQLALFVLVVVTIVAMGVFVWWRSRVARRRRLAAGRDPVTVAREHGGDVRKPRPPGIVD